MLNIRVFRSVAIVSALAIMPTVVSSEEVETRPPNVVLIISDDQAWTDYSFMGHPHIQTPRIDRLAAESLTFRRGYVPSSLCSPSLATILSGLFPHQHKITSNDPPLPEGKTRREAWSDPDFLALRSAMEAYHEQMPSLPRRLAELEYLSLQTGKWWGGHYKRGGFTHGMTHGDPARGGRHGDDGLTIGREGMNPIFDFIDEATEQDRPFFVWYAPFLPHTPHNPPDRLFQKYENVAPTSRIAQYWAMCEWFDETCGNLLDFLDDRDLSAETLVIYVTDNGWIQDPEANTYAPRSKRSPHEGGIRTPILLRWPGRIEPLESRALAHSIDLAPTILTAAGLDPSPELQGMNLLDAEAVANRAAIFGAIFTHNAVDIHEPASSLLARWVISGPWKLIVPSALNDPDGEVELYQLLDDPHETSNLAEVQAERVEALRDTLDQWWNGTQN